MRLTATLALALFPALASAAPNCLPIAGTVRLTPETDACTTIAGMMPGVPFDTTQCFKVSLKLAGFIPALGYAGVTHEPLTGALLPPSLDPQTNQPVYASIASPAYVGLEYPPRQAVQTARSTFRLGGTQFYAAEVIVSQLKWVDGDPVPQPLRVTEQSVITGNNGQGLFRGYTTGGINILGNSINQDAQVRGEVCRP